MSTSDATTNIIIAMINNHFIAETDDISEAYKTIYKTIAKPLD